MQAIEAYKYLAIQNLPCRKYLQKQTSNLNRQTKIQSTLLEYGQENILLSNILSKQRQQSTQSASSSDSKKPIKLSEENQQKFQKNNEEEKNLKNLINEMETNFEKEV